MQDWASSFYHSQAWLSCRRSYISQRIAIDGGLCERCRRAHGRIVHHKAYLTPDNIDNPAVSLSHGNLQYVCQRCHNDEHLTEDKPLRYRWDEWGNILPP